MVKIEKGQLLQSTAALAGTYFENTTILIAEVNEKGALGFVINKSFNRHLNQLVEFSHCRAFPFFEGGPVDQEHLYVVHQRPDLIDNGVHISNSLFYGGNFQQVLQAINQQLINEAELKLFIGYCGWDTGELEAEIEEGSWLLKDEPAHQVITGKG